MLHHCQAPSDDLHRLGVALACRPQPLQCICMQACLQTLLHSKGCCLAVSRMLQYSSVSHAHKHAETLKRPRTANASKRIWCTAFSSPAKSDHHTGSSSMALCVLQNASRSLEWSCLTSPSSSCPRAGTRPWDMTVNMVRAYANMLAFIMRHRRLQPATCACSRLCMGLRCCLR